MIFKNSPTISSEIKDRANNFNLIRLIAAVMVIISHSYVLTYGKDVKDPLHNLVGFSLGTLAVYIFFATSGFLVLGSYLRNTLSQYFQSRILRILPGLFICNLITILFIGFFISNLPYQYFFFDKLTLQYLFDNSFLLRKGIVFNLPFSFPENPLPNVVNGSLWTLPIEIKMYLSIPVLGLIGIFKKHIYFNLFFLIAICVLIFNHNTNIAINFQFYFILGMFIYVNRVIIPLNHLLGFSSIILFIVFLIFPNNILLYISPFFITYLTFYLGLFIKGPILKFNLLGDYSYGIYIYAFPIQQSIWYFLKPNLITMILLSLLITFILSIISWHIIEKPFLMLKNKNKFITRILNNIGLISENVSVNNNRIASRK